MVIYTIIYVKEYIKYALTFYIKMYKIVLILRFCMLPAICGQHESSGADGKGIFYYEKSFG